MIRGHEQFRRALYGGVAYLALAAPAYGQDGNGAAVLDTLTVVGTRTELSVLENPRSVSVVGPEQIERQAPSSIGELLEDIPGVELVDSSVPGMRRLSIRGESSRRVTVLVDGQVITDHSSYGTPLLINPAAVERIDVIRGPASVLYGGKAIGGVINIITKKGVPGKAVEVEIGGTYYSGSDGGQGWVNVGGTVGDFDYRITGGAATFDDLRVPEGQFTATGRLTTTAHENDDISGHIGFTFGENRNHYVSLKAEQYRLESEAWTDPTVLTGNPPLVAGPTFFNIDLPERDRRKVGIYYDGTDLTDWLAKLHIDAYYQTIDRLFENNVATFSPPTFVPFPPPGGFTPPFTTSVRSTSDDTLTNYGGLVQADLDLLEGHETIVGVQYLADVLETSKTSAVSTTPFIFPASNNSSFTEARIDTFSVFAQDAWDLTDYLRLTAGVRYNHIRSELEEVVSTQVALTPGSRTQDQVSSSVGLTYTGIPDTTFRVLYSSGYISPTLLQSYGRTSAGGQPVFGNPGLELETADNFEIGARYDRNGLVFDLAAFYTMSDNYITIVDCNAVGAPACPQVGRPPRINGVYTNIDESVAYGLELFAQYTFPGTQWTPYVNAAWIRRRFDFPQFSTYDSNVPAFAGRFGLRYEWQAHGFDLWADLFARASTEVRETLLTDTGITTTRVGGWGTLNLAFGGTYGEDDHLRFVLEFDNITDEEYRPLTDALPGVGRSIKLTVAATF